MKARNQKMLQQGPKGINKLRIFHRKAHGKTSSRFLVKCGCCSEQVEIYYDADEIEINGVLGSVADWSELLLPLLTPEKSCR